MSEETPKPATEPLLEPQVQENAPEQAVGPSAGISPVTVLALAAIVLVGVMIVINVNRSRANEPVSAKTISSLQADLTARRIELNRQRAELGLSPLISDSEPIDDIAKRLKKDSDTLVSLTSRFQEMLAEKDTLLSTKNAELIRSEQLRQSLVQESSRLRTEMQSAQAGGAEADFLRKELSVSKNKVDALAAELSSAREQIAAQGKMASPDDVADLQRRLVEANNAKDFFEKRARDLEAQKAPGAQ